MKYIKLYESFETDLEDILLEIEDRGYCTIIFDNYLMIDHPIRNININEVEDCLLRLKDYLADRYLMCHFAYSYFDENRLLSWSKKEIDLDNLNDLIYNGYTLNRIFIYYKRQIYTL